MVEKEFLRITDRFVNYLHLDRLSMLFSLLRVGATRQLCARQAPALRSAALLQHPADARAVLRSAGQQVREFQALSVVLLRDLDPRSGMARVRAVRRATACRNAAAVLRTHECDRLCKRTAIEALHPFHWPHPTACDTHA